MIIPDRKKLASIMVGRIGSPKMHEEKPEVASNEDDTALMAIAGDLLQAVKDNSPSGIVDALRAFQAEYETSEDSE